MGAVETSRLLTVEDCRRKAAEWLEAAKSSSDPMARLSFFRAADVWTKLAQQVEQQPLNLPSRPVRQGAGQVKGRTIGHDDSVGMGDVLRERLQLMDDIDIEPHQSRSN